MNKDDISKNIDEKVYIKILIPAYNDYPLKDMKHWMKKAYHQARLKLSRRKADKFKQVLPIETAAYAEDKVFGNWRLVAPSRDGEISPLQQVITLIRDEIVPIRWGEFRRKFICEMKICFNAICESDYDPKMVDEVNERLKELLEKFVRTAGTVRLEFVLKPETAEDRSSLKNLTIRSAIWMRFDPASGGLDFSEFMKPEGSSPICRQMEMDLELKINSI